MKKHLKNGIKPGIFDQMRYNNEKSRNKNAPEFSGAW
jgi:hypothetical protein